MCSCHSALVSWERVSDSINHQWIISVYLPDIVSVLCFHYNLFSLFPSDRVLLLLFLSYFAFSCCCFVVVVVVVVVFFVVFFLLRLIYC